MTVLSFNPQELDRFGKLLGLLGSNHDGERANAAAKATAFLADRQLAWTDVGEALKRPPIPYQPSMATSREHQADARRCLDSDLAWRLKERAFLLQMMRQLRSPSPKQREWLDGLVDRLTRHEMRRAA